LLSFQSQPEVRASLFFFSFFFSLKNICGAQQNLNAVNHEHQDTQNGK
jgi:hypothetical protein